MKNLYLKCGLFALVLAMQVFAPSAGAQQVLAPSQDSLIWRSGPIPVEENDRNLVEAKAKAVANARRQAFLILLKRLLNAEERRLIPLPSDLQLQRLQYSLSIDEEKIGAGRYQAQPTVVWNREEIITLLIEAGITRPLAEPEPFLLVFAQDTPLNFPVAPLPELDPSVIEDDLAADDDAADDAPKNLAEAWSIFDTMRFYGQVDVFFDENTSKYETANLLAKNTQTYDFLLRRNHAYRLKILNFETVQQEDVLREIDYRDGAISESLYSMKNYRQLVMQGEGEEWMLKLRADLEEKWHEEEQAALINHGTEVTHWRVRAVVDDPNYWQTLHDTINSTPWVQNLQLSELGLDEIIFEFDSIGETDKVLSELSRRGFALELQENGVWLLKVIANGGDHVWRKKNKFNNFINTKAS